MPTRPSRLAAVLAGVLAGGTTLVTAAVAHPGIPAPGAQSPSRAADRIALDDFKLRHAAGSALVVDVRGEESFRHGRIPGALHVPLDRVDARADEIRRLAAGRLVVTYCACAGEHSSLAAAERLTARGVRAAALTGGYTMWMLSGGRIEK